MTNSNDLVIQDHSRSAQRHFARVAAFYGDYHSTAPGIVDAIIARLPSSDRALRVADLGCGAGRYSRRLAACLPENATLLCCDRSATMLAHCRRNMNAAAPVIRFCCVDAEALPFRRHSLDVITVFQAVHHFDLEPFLATAGQVLRPGGLLAIHTRTPEQHRRTLWGRHFPGFERREMRLYPAERLERAVFAVPHLRWGGLHKFTHVRREPTAAVLARAHHALYSTFALYAPDEFTASLGVFAGRLARLGNGTIEYTTENALILVHRTETTTVSTDIAP